VAAAKKVIQKADPDAWDMALRQYLQDTFEEIKTKISGDIPNLGGWLHKRTFGNVRQRKILYAAMEPEQYKNFFDFMEIMRRTGLIYTKESASNGNPADCTR
jgi:hypothetical protein